MPFGSVMELEPGVTLSKIRYFLQDEENEWCVCSDVTADSYTIEPDFPVYTAKQTVTLNQGDTMRLSVSDGAAAPANYQWYHDGKAISGAVKPELTFTADDKDAAGTYSVTITSSLGTAKTADICEVKDVIVQSLTGDVNADGKFDRADPALLLAYLLKKENTLPNRNAADADRNNMLNAGDLTLLKRQLLCQKT